MAPLSPHMLAAAHASAPAAIGPAVAVAFVIGCVWKFTIFRDGKGTPAGRLVACLLAMIVGWTLLAVAYPQAAESVASGSAAGVVTLLGGVKGILNGV